MCYLFRILRDKEVNYNQDDQEYQEYPPSAFWKETGVLVDFFT